MARVTILVSGEGKLMRRLLESTYVREMDHLQIAGVISSDAKAPALTTARSLGVPAYEVDVNLFPNAASFGLALLNKLKDIDTDYVIVDDFVPSLGPAARVYYGKVMCLFPALIPAFEQLNKEQVIAATIARGVKLTGVTAYLADEQGNIGRIIAQYALDVLPEDTVASLSERMFEQLELPLMQTMIRVCCAGNSN